MLPDKADKRWEDLVTGKIKHEFKSVPAAMCVARHVRALAQGADKSAVEKSVEDVYAFFIKYQPILKEDIQAVFGR
ncbi:MAG: hypothetical protein EA427_09290 [Spirochaetaceae bacterium]|nr:MAG: hypothetical protein EA427_09290 [Spirochaetaceae bacterium]